MADDGNEVLVGAITGVVGAIVAGIAWCIGKRKGHAKGVEDGCIKASKEYEKKLLAQAEQFLCEKNRLSANAAKKDELIDKLVGLLKQTKDVKRQMDIQTMLSRVRAA